MSIQEWISLHFDVLDYSSGWISVIRWQIKVLDMDKWMVVLQYRCLPQVCSNDHYYDLSRVCVDNLWQSVGYLEFFWPAHAVKGLVISLQYMRIVMFNFLGRRWDNLLQKKLMYRFCINYCHHSEWNVWQLDDSVRLCRILQHWLTADIWQHICKCYIQLKWDIIFYHAITCVWYGYMTSVFMEIVYMVGLYENGFLLIMK